MNQMKTDILKSFESKLEETKVAVEKIMIKETEKLKKAMETEFEKLHGCVEDWKLETRRNNGDDPFDPQSCIVIFHMKPQGETESTEQLKSAVNTMLTDGLESQNIQVLLVAHTPHPVTGNLVLSNASSAPKTLKFMYYVQKNY